MNRQFTTLIADLGQFNSNELVKFSSKFLRGNIDQGLKNPVTGGMPADDPLLLKFHGIYQQDNRDFRAQRQERLLEPNYQFMVRLRIPGGLLSKQQWIGLDAISRKYSDRGIRITTRQTIQLHGVRKRNLKACMQALKRIGIDTVAACGDDSRGVVCGGNPMISRISREVQEIAKRTSNRLIPRTSAYEEIWYGESKSLHSANEEPIYGPLYLPRKFKVGFAIPPTNDIDVYGQDVGFIAVVRKERLIGFNLCVGGGMGQVDTRDDSYPRLAQEIGFIKPDEAPEVAEIIMEIQRDHGDRKDRHQARFKYTLDRLGLSWFLNVLQERRGKPLLAPYPINFTRNSDDIGWQRGDDGLWQCTLHIESGRITGALQDQLAGLYQQYGGFIRLTTNQNLQLTHIHDYELPQLKTRLDDLGLAVLTEPDLQSANTLTCVALPTCGLAMAEAERYVPSFLPKFNQVKSSHGLSGLPITLRITGCPNGCARPYIAEIALTGRAPGLYNLYLGGSHTGNRLAKLYASNVNEVKILELLSDLMKRYKTLAHQNERFGDFLVRTTLLEDMSELIENQ
ncbi:NADPH-dependent assimilatory sulfite reductase hemoprotein subunit [Methylobacillus caricis]|uniref:NADPH-dependent assimilatory sulfite reductase hemoprotein subunit n=1 Tax=Methylobacillus caricis TaxID=1971611 RepID=UPI001CFF879E|nr:NADPH-dependent assimilatory sulfite reductase hemoprotein subunit [Methylobacillus caricis]MCB5186645.1 NADPH-dependent assimilatory sulfite reductase hemoprotein subunit [Methylobacillus caricis]